MKILLIENNPHNADPVREALAKLGASHVEVARVDRLAAALAYLETGRPDVVLLDVALPNAAGLVGLARLYAAAPDIPVVVLVDADDENFCIDAVRNGAYDCLVKHRINAISLNRVVRCAVERKRYERARRETALRDSETRLRTVTDNIPALIAYVGLDRRYRFVSQFHEEWFGLSVAELTGKSMEEVLGADDYASCQQHIEKALQGQRVTFEQCMIRNNLERFLQIVYIPDYDSSKKVIGFYVLGNNITETKLNEARLESMALYDPLTGLANRLLLTDRVSQAIAHAQRHSSVTALIYLDLDEFKQVNDTFGHDVGDLLLREVAERLVSAVRQEDTVARLGGDEFIIAMWQVGAPGDAAKLAAKLINIVSQPYSIRGHTLTLTASAGAGLYPAQGKDMETLMKSADLAMYQAKRSGKNAYHVFDYPHALYA